MKNLEQEKWKFGMTRRQFLTAMACLGLGALETKQLADMDAEFRYNQCQEALTFKPLPYGKPTLFDRGGMGFNTVYSAFRSPESFCKTLDFAVDNNVTLIRAIFDCPDSFVSGADYEPQLGNFRDNVLSKFTKFCQAAASREMNLIVVLSDGFRMGNCLKYNPVYGSFGKEILSPYYIGDADGGPWSHFYTDKNMIKAYLSRAGKIVNAVREVLTPQLASGSIQLYFEPMNEPLPKPLTEMNTWLTMVSDQLQAEYGVTCLAGVADPDTVTNPRIPATVHYYPNPLDSQEGRIRTLISGRNILFEEGGEMSRLFGIGLDQDTHLRDYLTDFYFQTNFVDWLARTVQPLAQPNICLWQADLEQDDGWLIGPHLSQSRSLIQGFSTQYQGMK